MTITYEITYEQLAADLVAFATEHPDRKNPEVRTPQGGAMCRYTEPDGTPSCLVGHVLHKYGLAPEFGDNMNLESAAECSVWRDDKTAFLATDIQFFADRGDTWSEAVVKVVVVGLLGGRS